jgi:hypothetical protein
VRLGFTGWVETGNVSTQSVRLLASIFSWRHSWRDSFDYECVLKRPNAFTPRPPRVDPAGRAPIDLAPCGQRSRIKLCSALTLAVALWRFCHLSSSRPANSPGISTDHSLNSRLGLSRVAVNAEKYAHAIARLLIGHTQLMISFDLFEKRLKLFRYDSSTASSGDV